MSHLGPRSNQWGSVSPRALSVTSCRYTLSLNAFLPLQLPPPSTHCAGHLCPTAHCHLRIFLGLGCVFTRNPQALYSCSHCKCSIVLADVSAHRRSSPFLVSMVLSYSLITWFLFLAVKFLSLKDFGHSSAPRPHLYHLLLFPASICLSSCSLERPCSTELHSHL